MSVEPCTRRAAHIATTRKHDSHLGECGLHTRELAIASSRAHRARSSLVFDLHTLVCMKTFTTLSIALVMLVGCVAQAPEGGTRGPSTGGPADDPNGGGGGGGGSGSGSGDGSGTPNPTMPPAGGDPCATDPDSDECYCTQEPMDPFCQQQPQPPGPGGGADPCQTDPNSDECYCQEVPQDPFCQQQCDPQDPQCQGGGDPCEQDPFGDACYCQWVPQDPFCQQQP